MLPVVIPSHPAIAKSPFQVAYVARYYHPPGDKRESHFQVYVCDIHGTRRKQITFGNKDCEAVCWSDQNTLTWLQGEDSWTAKFPKLVPIRLGPVGGENARQMRVGITGDINPIPPWTEQDTDEQGNEVWHPKGQQPVAKIGIDEGTQVHTDVPGGGYEEGAASIVQRGGRIYTLKLPGELRSFAPAREENLSYVYSNDLAASAGSYAWIHKMDWRAGKLTLIVENAIDIEFSPNSRYWCGLQGGRQTSAFGKNHRVWTCEGWVGKTNSSKYWKIVKGLAWVTAIRLRPR